MVNQNKICWAAIGISGVSVSILLARYYQEFQRKQKTQIPEVVEDLSKDD
jgi:uncharacterized membrane protein YuzA (DUF378 family)